MCIIKKKEDIDSLIFFLIFKKQKRESCMKEMIHNKDVIKLNLPNL